MIKGETRTLRHAETGEVAWTYNTASIVITLPDGTLGTPPAVSGALDPNNPLTWIFSCQYTPPVGGKYVMTWHITPANSDVLYRPVDYLVYWTDVQSYVRQKLQQSPSALPDYEIDREFASIVRSFQNEFIGIGAYTGLSVTDQEPFDEGIALLVALRLRLYKFSSSPSGPIKVWKIQQTTLEFVTGPASKTAVSLEDQWLIDAYNALGMVAAIRLVIDARKTFSLFAISGPSRTAKINRNDTLFSLTARLLSDYAYFGQGAGLLL